MATIQYPPPSIPSQIAMTQYPQPIPSQVAISVQSVKENNNNSTITCMKFLALLLCSSVHLIFGITSLVIYFEHDTCYTTYGGISFDYGTWLLIQGIYCLFIVLLILSTTFCKTEESKILIQCAYCLIASFALSWLIVGGILFFKTVNDQCDSGSRIHIYGLALFIMQILFRGCAL